jgi:hypothetical protein
MHREKVYIGLLLIKAFKGTGESSKEGEAFALFIQKKNIGDHILFLYII